MTKYLYLLLAFAYPAMSFAQQAPAASGSVHNFTMKDCIDYAYAHQHDVANANLDITGADYHVKEITGQGYPQLSGSAAFQDYIKSPTILFPDFVTPAIYGVLNKEGVKNGSGATITVPTSAGLTPVNFTQKYNSNIGVTLNQILFDPNYFVGLQTRKTYKELYVRAATRTKIEANVAVTKAYYQVLVSGEQIKLLDANVAELKQQLDETSARNKQGFVEKIDVDRLTVQYNSLLTNRENTLRMLTLNYELLKFQMGMPIEEELTLKDHLEDIKLDGAVSADKSSDSSVYKNRIEYSLLELQKQMNEFDVKSKKGQFLPRLTGNVAYSANYQNNSFSQLYSTNFPQAYIGLNLNIPIYSGGQHKYQLAESRINVQKSENDLLNMKNTISLQISQARISYINGLQTLNDQKRNQALAAEVLRVAKIKYQQGVGSSIEVTQAETDLQNADNSYINGLYQALISKVDLDKAYGRIQ